MTDFWQRLKQRKLVQWAVAYVAGAFALLQGSDFQRRTAKALDDSLRPAARPRIKSGTGFASTVPPSRE